MEIKTILIIFIFYTIFSFILSQNDNNDAIRFAFILSRTGSHSPSYLKEINYSSNKDIFGYNWIGKNELTTVGKIQQYYLGYLNHLKYKNVLISEQYHPKELLAVSSESNRTIQSSYANLHGLYQQSKNLLTKEKIELAVPPLEGGDIGYIYAKNEIDVNNYVLPNNIQIVPVKTFTEKSHYYLLEKVENCPKIKKFYEEGESLAKKKIEEILNYSDEKENNGKTYGEILVDILNNENIFKNDYTIDDLKNNSTFFKIIAETFICDYFEAVDLNKFTPKGINIYKLLKMFEEYLGEISIGGGIKKKEDERAVKTLELAEKVNYNLLDELRGWMEERVNFDINKDFNALSYSSPKIVLYLSHHESIESLYYFLKETFNIDDANNSLYVNFTSFIGIELYRNKREDEIIDKNNFYIKLLYDNKQLGQNIPYNLFYETLENKSVSLNILDEYCGFNEEKINPYDYNDDNYEKKKENNDSEESLIYKYMGISLISLFPILLSYVIFLLYKN